MLINVYNKETTKVEKVESGKLDTKIHFHRNTHAEFSKDDLAGFWCAESSEKPLEKLNKEALLLKVAELEIQWVTSDNTKAEIILAIREAE